MTGPEFQAALDALEWTASSVSRLLDCNSAQPRRWASGALPVPDSIAVWLLELVEAHRLHPAPAEWRLRAKKRSRIPLEKKLHAMKIFIA